MPRHRTGSRPPASKKSFRVGDRVAIKPALSHKFPPAYAGKAFIVRKVLTHADDPVEIDPGERYYDLEGVSLGMAEGFLRAAPAGLPTYARPVQPSVPPSRPVPPPPASRWNRAKKWLRDKVRRSRP